jgi:lipoprotein-anchoring transpeptidase ErfK/SrfK
MMHKSPTQLAVTTLLLASIASPAVAQRSTRPARPAIVDTAITSLPGDSLSQGHNWFVSLLRKIARKSDDNGMTGDGGGSDVSATESATSVMSFKSRKDSISWENARSTADNSKGFRIVVDLFGKTLRVIDGNDTLRTAPVATAKNESLEYGGRVWKFVTPRGVRTVLRKDREPVWTPPEWHFAEIALEYGLKVRQLERGKVVKLKDGTKLLTQGDEVGIIRPGETEFVPMALDEHIVFDNTIFIPPNGTKHRVIQGELGHFRLDMGDGYMLHGTPYQKSIGAAVTHGCVRMHDEDIEWLYENVPVGTKVYIY